MRAITTKYHGATNHLPARLSASDHEGNRIIMSRWDESIDADDTEGMHVRVALALCDKMGWALGNGLFLAGGGTKRGMVFVFAECPNCSKREAI